MLKSHLEERYRLDSLDPTLSVQDWGLTYAELEPHFARFMQPMAYGLDDADIEAVAAYYATVRPARLEPRSRPAGFSR